MRAKFVQSKQHSGFPSIGGRELEIGCCQNLSCIFLGIAGQKGQNLVKFGKIAVIMRA